MVHYFTFKIPIGFIILWFITKEQKKRILLITILKQFPITTVSGQYTNNIGDLYRTRHRVELFAMVEVCKYKNLYYQRHETSSLGAHTSSYGQDGRRSRERKLTCPQRRLAAHCSVIVIIFMIIVIYLFLFYFALQVVQNSRVPTGF